MSKLYQDNESWIFESDNGIRYSIYEATGDGAKKHTHTDIYIIILDDYYDDDVNTEFVGWGYGYELINQEDEEYVDIIKGIVDGFENSHKLIVQEIGKERPFIDDVEMMYDFFKLTREEFLEVWQNQREKDYDATAKKIAEWMIKMGLKGEN